MLFLTNSFLKYTGYTSTCAHAIQKKHSKGMTRTPVQSSTTAIQLVSTEKLEAQKCFYYARTVNLAPENKMFPLLIALGFHSAFSYFITKPKSQHRLFIAPLASLLWTRWKSDYLSRVPLLRLPPASALERRLSDPPPLFFRPL